MHSPPLRDLPFDPAGAGPPLPDDEAHRGNHTMRPVMLPLSSHPGPGDSKTGPVGRWLERQRREALRVREILQRHRGRLERMVGKDNLRLSFWERVAFSTDSTGLRGLVPEAVVIPPDEEALSRLLAWCHLHRVPVVPYGAGSGYNMGVVPLAPSLAVWTACLKGVRGIRPHPSPHGRVTHVVTVGAGEVYHDLLREVRRRGFVLRCQPNSPRASCGGVVSTGSSGGKRVGEVVWGGDAVLASGQPVRFQISDRERSFWRSSPFPQIHKFFDAPGPAELRLLLRDNQPLPSTLFVGAEGTTGFITSVDLELELPASWCLTAAVWLSSLSQVPRVVRTVHERLAPVYFELLTQPAIDSFLRADFPDLFTTRAEAYLVFSVEHDDHGWLKRVAESLPQLLGGVRTEVCGPYPTHHPPEAALRLVAPREQLPKKLVSKCKTDLEVAVDALPRVIPMVAEVQGGRESLLFGHLTSQVSAILHWNIGGVDMADESSLEAGWRIIEGLLERAGHGSSVAFTGEHGVAGKPWLWLPLLPRNEVAKLLRLKRVLDPRGLVNPYKLALPTKVSKGLRGRALAKGAHVGLERLRSSCSRCNACQNCPVLEAETSLRAQRSRVPGPLLAGKRSLLHALELASCSLMPAHVRQALWQSIGSLTAACFSCGRCDRACPVGIRMEDLERSLPMEPRRTSWRTQLLWLLFLGPLPKTWSVRLAGSVQRAARGLGRRAPLGSQWSLLAMPPLEASVYRPRQAQRSPSPDLRLVASSASPPRGQLVVRFRGCVGTVGRVAATWEEDTVFTALGIPLLDFVPDLCCGFPHHAAGKWEEASRRRRRLAERLHRAMETVRVAWSVADLVVTSSCPTCQESLRRGFEDLGLDWQVRDPSQLIASCLPSRVAGGGPVGLQIPCHLSPEGRDAQVRALVQLGFDPVVFDRCCGMAGLSRFRHPERGEAIAHGLWEELRSSGVQRVVSSCPSCRDGLLLQASREGERLEVLGFSQAVVRALHGVGS